MKLIILLAAVLAVVVTASAATPSNSQSGPTIAQLKQRIQDLRSDKADLQDEVDTLNQVVSDQNDTITRLRYRLANQPDPLDVITSRGPDGLWAAMRAIWQAFPNLDPGQLCGYDKSNSPGDGIGLTVTIYSFEKWSGC